jgi:Flp pilus assembly protein TadB
MGISEQATAAQAPAFTDAAQQHGVDRGRAESSERQGNDWPLAALLLTGGGAFYAVATGVIFVLVTSVSWQLLAVGGLLLFLFGFTILFGVELQETRRRAREVAAPPGG